MFRERGVLGGDPRSPALEERHVPEPEQAHDGPAGARPHPPAHVTRQRVTDEKQDNKRQHPAEGDDGGHLAVVCLPGRGRRAPLCGTDLPIVTHGTRLADEAHTTCPSTIYVAIALALITHARS